MAAGRRQIMSSYIEATADSSVGSPKIGVRMDRQGLGPGQSVHCCLLKNTSGWKRMKEEEEVGGER